MKRFRILFALSVITFLLLQACNGDDKTGRSSRTSSGQPYELMIVHDGDTSVRNALNRVLGQPFPALPRPESWFDLHFVHIDNLVNLHKRQRNILFAGTFENENDLSDIIEKLFGSETIREVLENPSRFYASARNVWASPQLVMAMFAETAEELAGLINEHDRFLIDQLDASESRRLEREILNAPKNRSLLRQIERKHRVTFHLPPLYDIANSVTAEEDDILQFLGLEGFLWLRGETDKTNRELMIYYIKYEDQEQLSYPKILALRDSVGKYFIPGPAEGSYMQSEMMYMPHHRELEYNGMYAIETRGLWRVEGDHMGGPFINYAVLDEAGNRIIFFDGFLYAPEVRKRNFLKRMEVVLNSLKVTNGATQ